MATIFGMSTSPGVTGMMPHPGSNQAYDKNGGPMWDVGPPGRPPPPFALHDGEHHVVLPQQRVGTDPTKFKTVMCRNWEATGTCNFRGCTFAHGPVELRHPAKSPLLHAQSATESPALSDQSPGVNQNQVSPPRGMQLLELLVTEVRKDRDLLAAHQEANRTLEVLLRKEQLQRQEDCRFLQDQEIRMKMLGDAITQRDAYIKKLVSMLSEQGVAVPQSTIDSTNIPVATSSLNNSTSRSPTEPTSGVPPYMTPPLGSGFTPKTGPLQAGGQTGGSGFTALSASSGGTYTAQPTQGNPPVNNENVLRMLATLEMSSNGNTPTNPAAPRVPSGDGEAR